jgi:hypothetical protein
LRPGINYFGEILYSFLKTNYNHLSVIQSRCCVTVTLPCHGHAAVSQSHCRASVTLLCHSHAAVPQSRCRVTVTLLCHSHAAVSQSRCRATVTLQARVTLPYHGHFDMTLDVQEEHSCFTLIMLNTLISERLHLGLTIIQ